jgi:bacillithiol biosynthesis deacetylase BshB1
MNEKCFLVVAPHPDDAELGMGGTILALKDMGHRVFVVDLTTGEPTPCGDEDKRRRETERATDLLGIDGRMNLGLPNRYLFDSKDARLLLAGRIRKVRPDCILCPYPEDAHPDHLAAAAITIGARFYAKYTGISTEDGPWYTGSFFHFFCSHLRTVPRFSFVVDTSNYFEKKIETIRCFRSQFIENPKNRTVFDYVQKRDAYFGSLIGSLYAEPFYSVETLGVADPGVFISSAS